jgi:hypothetical protein
LSTSSHATHTSCAADTPENASVASPGLYTVPLKLLTDTVAAGSVALAATAATHATKAIFFISSTLLFLGTRHSAALRVYLFPIVDVVIISHSRPFPQAFQRI